MNISRQIGWSNESNLLYQILKQLTKLTNVIFNLTPKYKVYTALLTQSGDNNAGVLTGSDLTIGVTYEIKTGSIGTFDFTNVGAPNNDIGTFFVATGTTPNDWSGASLNYNDGAPVVKVLENTIGNIWFIYNDVGSYNIKSNGLFIQNKTTFYINLMGDDITVNNLCFGYLNDTNNIGIATGNSVSNALSNNVLVWETPIEIRVYN